MKICYIKELRIALSVGMILLTYSLLAQEEVRTYNGSNNNLQHPYWGANHTQLKRIVAPDYGDKISTPAGSNRPNPRMISNALFAQADEQGETILINNQLQLSDYVWVYGQFLDHDISLSDPGEEPFMVPVNFPDHHFNPGGVFDNVVIPMNRTKPLEGTGTSIDNPREHFNEINSWIDGSVVYGSDAFRANWLRLGEDGKLKVSSGNLMPYNTLSGEMEDIIDIDAPFMGDDVGSTPRLFVSGDVRANENPLLIGLHTLFVREHNRLCEEYAHKYPDWSDEQLYQKVRKIVGGTIQAIAYEEWLPTMGIHLEAYTGYNENVDPTVLNVFSAAAFRLGHTLLNGNINRVNLAGDSHPEGPFTLREVFFKPSLVNQEGLEPFLKGMSLQVQQEMDAKVVDDVRNFLFGPPGSGGLDLVAININRGRERGIPDINTIREALGLIPYRNFTQITNNDLIAGTIHELYKDINNIDAWVGMLAEEHLPNTLFGETITTILQYQFTALRNGDRFYYEYDPALTKEEKNRIKNTRLSEVIMRNTEIAYMQPNVFRATSPESICGYFGNETVLWGNIRMESGTQVSDVRMNLSSMDNDQLIMSEMVESFFSLEEVPTCENIAITPSKEDDYYTGISTLDMILTLRHIIQIEKFDSPYQYIAADVNKSGSITTADIVAIRKVILGMEKSFPNNTAWRFVDAHYEFQNPNNPLQEHVPESIVMQLNGKPNDVVANQDFIAIKVGDVNHSLKSQHERINNPRTNQQLAFILPDIQLEEGEIYTIPIRAKAGDNLLGFQISLQYDPTQIVYLKATSNLENWEYISNIDGSFSALYGEALPTPSEDLFFEIMVQAKENIQLSEVLEIADYSIPSEVYTEDLEVKNIQLQYITNDPLWVKQNKPNPFTNQTRIEFELSKEEFVELEITDPIGRRVLTRIIEGKAGYNEELIYRSDLATTGLLFYHLKIAKRPRITKAMFLN